MKLNKYQKLLIVIFILVATVYISYKSLWKNNREIFIVSPYEVDEKKEPISFSEAEIMEIYVHVEGAVKNPGVYKFHKNIRVYEAVEAAGGLTEEADTGKINMAMKLQDEGYVYVPSKGEDTMVESSIIKPPTKSDKVNINTADLKELTSLTGIGDTIAKRVIEYRNKNGAFKTIEDIKKVSGIGDSKFQAIKEKIIVR